MKTVVVDATELEKPTLSQTYATLRICLRYGESSANIFNRLIKVLETTDFIHILSMMPDEELERLMPMLAQRLTRLRLEMAEIPLLYSISRKMGVAELQQVRICDVAQSKMKLNGSTSMCHLHLLGQLLPRLDMLNVHAAVVASFPNNFRNLRALLLRQGTSQLVLDEICAHCPQLQRLFLRNESSELLDASNILKCSQLKELQLPLMLRSPLAVCHLTHLEHLSLQRLQLWPGLDWLPIVREIITAKRYELRSLRFDGSWLVTPLDLSLLQLKHCWALQEVLLSNCKLAEHTTQPELPLSCHRFGLRGCKLSWPLRYLKSNAQLQLLDFFDCQLAAGGYQLLQHLLKQRQCLPAVMPLQLRFSNSTPLRAELTSWPASRRQHNEAWLKVMEVDDDVPTWKQPIGTISMTFGKPINYTPDLDLRSSTQAPVPATR